LVEVELVRPVGPGLGQVGQRSARQVVEHVDLVPLGQQPIDQGRSDEPRPSRHQSLHNDLVSCPRPDGARQLSTGTRTPSRRAPASTVSPSPITVPPTTSAPAATTAPSPRTESSSRAAAPTRAPGRSTDRSTLAPASPTVPGPSTDRTTDAPGATVASGWTPASGVPRTPSSRSSCACR